MPWTKFRKAVEIGDASLFQENSHGGAQLLSESEGAQLWMVPDQPMGNASWNPKWLLEKYDSSHRLSFQEALGESELVVHVKTRLHNYQSLEQHLYSLHASHGISKVLLVTGDRAQVGDLTTRHALEFLSRNCRDLFSRMDFGVTWDASSVDAKSLRRQELWLEEKLEFGATAVFTQPCWGARNILGQGGISDAAISDTPASDTEFWHRTLGIPQGSALITSLKKIPIFPGLMRISSAQQWPQFWQAQLSSHPALSTTSDAEQLAFHKRLSGVFGRYWTPQSDLDYM